jgi:hypothetical protein
MSPFSSLRSLSVGPALILANLLGVVTAQQWAPLMMDNTGTRNVPGRSDVNPYGWGDSYSVGNTCYCDTTYDHDIDEIIVSTPVQALF